MYMLSPPPPLSNSPHTPHPPFPPCPPAKSYAGAMDGKHIQWEAPATLCSLDVSLIFQQSGTPEYGGLSKLEGDCALSYVLF